tara:strand:- start:560 stop:808 length:249 start_codon:yes stop_codon:yes gene_type:complete
MLKEIIFFSISLSYKYLKYFLIFDKDEVHKAKKYEIKKPKIKLSDLKLKKLKSEKLIEIKNKDLKIILNENKNDLKFILSIA